MSRQEAYPPADTHCWSQWQPLLRKVLYTTRQALLQWAHLLSRNGYSERCHSCNQTITGHMWPKLRQTPKSG